MAGKAIQDNAVVLKELNKQTDFDPLRDGPRFQDLMRRMNFLQYEIYGDATAHTIRFRRV